MHCLIVEDHPVTLFGLHLLVQKKFPEWSVSTASCINDAMACIATSKNCPVELVLLDLDLPDGSGMNLLDFSTTNLQNTCACLVVSGDRNKATVELCRMRGAKGYLSKDCALSQVLQAISAIRAGEEYFSDEFSDDELVCEIKKIHFSNRQKDLMRLVMAGC